MSLPGSFQGNAGDPAVQPIRQLVDDFLDEVEAVTKERKLLPSAVTVLRPSSFYVVADRDSVHVVYTNVSPAGLPYVMIDDVAASNPDLAGHGLAVLQAVETKNGWTNCEVESLPHVLIAAPPQNRQHALRSIAVQYVHETETAARIAATEGEVCSLLNTSPPAAAGLIDGIRAAVGDTPAHKSAFVMMRYQESEHFGAIERAISGSLAAYGLLARYAKDKAFSDDLWENVRIYAHGSRYGIAVFEEIDARSFNPNVSIELGYMYALGRRVLLLKERRMPTLPTDIVGRIYRTFDVLHIETSIDQQIRQWVERDLGLVSIDSTQGAK